MSDSFNWTYHITPHSQEVTCQHCSCTYALAFPTQTENLWLPQRLALLQALGRHELECWGFTTCPPPQSEPGTLNHVGPLYEGDVGR